MTKILPQMDFHRSGYRILCTQEIREIFHSKKNGKIFELTSVVTRIDPHGLCTMNMDVICWTVSGVNVVLLAKNLFPTANKSSVAESLHEKSS